MWCTTGVNFRTTQFLKPIIFADETKLFCYNKEINSLFLKANLELEKISE